MLALLLREMLDDRDSISISRLFSRMHQHLTAQKTKQGFTLLEIMIVTAILALVATMAVPSVLRSRKQSMATRVLEDARLLNIAKDQWALERHRRGTDTPTADEIRLYLKSGHDIIADLYGTPYLLGNANQPVLVAPSTIGTFSDLFLSDEDESQFWGVHYPAALIAANQGNP